jgi:dephospho-CoA kinase
MIIGLSGKKQSGKTTIANYLVEKGDVGILCFADKIKEIVRDLFFEPEEDYLNLSNEAHKNTVLRCGWTPRELLQVVGTDLFRRL